MFDFIKNSFQSFFRPWVSVPSVYNYDAGLPRTFTLPYIDEGRYFTAAELQQLKVFIAEMIRIEEQIVASYFDFLTQDKKHNPRNTTARTTVRKSIQKSKKRIASLVALQKKIKYSIVTRG